MDLVKTPASHPLRPHEWAGPKKNFHLDAEGISDPHAFALAGHKHSAMKCVYEGVTAIFSPNAPFVAGDIVAIFTKSKDQYFGRIFYPDRKHLIIVHDAPSYHGHLIKREEVEMIGVMVERRIAEPFGPKCKDWIKYARETKNPKAPVIDNYIQRERRIDSRITAERVLAHFKTTGEPALTCMDTRSLSGWDYDKNRSRHKAMLTSDELRKLGITPAGDPGFSIRRINIQDQM